MSTLILDPRYDVRNLPPEDMQNLRERVYEAIRKELRSHGLPEECCVLGVPDGAGDGRICFHDEDGLWVFYVAERGRRSAGAFFQSAFDAANYLVWYLLCDPTKRNTDVGCISIGGSSASAL